MAESQALLAGIEPQRIRDEEVGEISCIDSESQHESVQLEAIDAKVKRQSEANGSRCTASVITEISAVGIAESGTICSYLSTEVGI